MSQFNSLFRNRRGWQPSLPNTGFLRLSMVLQLIPVSRSCFLEMVNRGEFARPVKLTARVTAWRAEDIRAFIESRSGVTNPVVEHSVGQQSNLSNSDLLATGAL